MKLVEILAAEMESWAGTTACYVQDPDGVVYPCISTPEFSDEWVGAPGFIDQNDEAISKETDLSSDYSTAIIKKSQWQAERDRQKGGEWKRHRGGKCPVQESQEVEVRFRDGEIEASYASYFFGWEHGVLDDKFTEIMAYRVISQPQAEEVKLSKAEVRAQFMPEPEFVYLEPKTDQIDGPIKWRDTVNELDAYIEEFTRERESLINRLALEGFALIPAMTAVMGVADIDFSDWRNWKAGDLVTYDHISTSNFTSGKQYTLSRVDEKRLSIDYDDAGDDNGWLTKYFKWHSRP